MFSILNFVYKNFKIFKDPSFSWTWIKVFMQCTANVPAILINDENVLSIISNLDNLAFDLQSYKPMGTRLFT